MSFSRYRHTVTRAVLVIVLLSFMIVFPLSKAESIMTGLSTEQLTRDSDAVVVGDVDNSETRWSDDGQTILTSSTVLVTEIVKGDAVQTRLTVEVEGGEIGDIGLKVSDVAPMVNGEKVLLFLKAQRSAKRGVIYRIVGKGQGKFSVGQDGVARKGGFALAAGKENVDNNIPLEVLREKIRTVR